MSRRDALDIGAMTVFLCFGEGDGFSIFRDDLCARLTVTYPRVGGQKRCPQEFLDSLWKFTDEFPSKFWNETLIDQKDGSREQ
jgi:NADH:ubiquinone oxidoreductase subunit D